jgi:hypothetical protein
MAVPVGLIVEASVAIIAEAVKLMKTINADELTDDEKEMMRRAQADATAERDRLLPIPEPPS